MPISPAHRRTLPFTVNKPRASPRLSLYVSHESLRHCTLAHTEGDHVLIFRAIALIAPSKFARSVDGFTMTSLQCWDRVRTRRYCRLPFNCYFCSPIHPASFTRSWISTNDAAAALLSAATASHAVSGSGFRLRLRIRTSISFAIRAPPQQPWLLFRCLEATSSLRRGTPGLPLSCTDQSATKFDDRHG
jgi:hypothetical protein